MTVLIPMHILHLHLLHPYYYLTSLTSLLLPYILIITLHPLHLLPPYYYLTSLLLPYIFIITLRPLHFLSNQQRSSVTIYHTVSVFDLYF